MSRQRAHDARLRAAGWRQIKAWLSPEMQASLAKLQNGRSEQKTIQELIAPAAKKGE